MPLKAQADEKVDELTRLKERLAGGEDAATIAREARGVIEREGGTAGLAGQVRAAAATLPVDLTEEEKGRIETQVERATAVGLGGKEKDPGKQEILRLLGERLQSDAESGKVTAERAAALKNMLQNLGAMAGAREEGVQETLAARKNLRDFSRSQFEIMQFPSYGLPRPAEGTRAAQLIELHWRLRRYLLEEMNRPGRGVEESKLSIELFQRTEQVDRSFYEAGSDDRRAVTASREMLRPLAVEVRKYAACPFSMPVRPIWGSAEVTVDTNAVLYSGSIEGRRQTEAACASIGLDVMPEAAGPDYARARWQQMQSAMTTVFDFRVEDGPQRAAVAYEMGIALTLGKPVVVLKEEGQSLPFDVDVPAVAPGRELTAAIDESTVWVHPRVEAEPYRGTLKYVLSEYRQTPGETLAGRTLRLLENQRDGHDPVAISQTIGQFFEFLGDGKTMLAAPMWAPAYPGADGARLFHVMPFRPGWANAVAATVRQTAERAGVIYVRGDEAANPNVIDSIWEEIARATFVVADLTGFNANVALELGMAHTLGRQTLMVGQGNTTDSLYASIAKLRVQPYDAGQLAETLGSAVRRWIGGPGRESPPKTNLMTDQQRLEGWFRERARARS